MDSLDADIARIQEERRKKEQEMAALSAVTFDKDLYGGNNRFEGYERSIPVNNDEDEEGDAAEREIARKLASYTAPKSLLKEIPQGGDDDDIGFKKPQRIVDREDDYRKRRLNRIISPDRNDAFAMGDKTPDAAVRTYADVMREEALKREKEETLRLIAKKHQEEKEKGKEDGVVQQDAAQAKRRNRWDQAQEQENAAKKAKVSASSDWDAPDATPGISRWDATPTPGRANVDATPAINRRNRWDETPTPGRLVDADATPVGGATPGATPAGMTWDATPKLSGLATPTPKKQRSRWDETPATMGSATPMVGATPSAFTPGVTPMGGIDLPTPTPSAINLRGAFTPEQYNLLRWEKDIEERNRPLTDEELDAMFPQEGYKILEPPASYVPIRTPARKLLATPTPLMGTPLYSIPEENRGQQFDVPKEVPGGLPFMKPEDYQYFGVLLNEDDEEELSPDEQKERKIMKLLLKVKNGTPPQRKTALRQLTDKAREFGAGPLFNQILPLLMSPTLEDQERHLLVKVIDRVLYKLDELVRPFVHKILVVIEPLLIDEDYYARVEGREIISNLSKAAGLATMIAAMRPDIDNIDEYVRNTTARAFSVVASALGIPALLPFLKAVCQSKKSWQARHTGIKIVQQIAILMGCAVLPHLRSLVEIIEHGLNDENQKVRTITALSLAALAEAAAPYGIESFDSVLKPLCKSMDETTSGETSTTFGIERSDSHFSSCHLSDIEHGIETDQQLHADLEYQIGFRAAQVLEDIQRAAPKPKKAETRLSVILLDQGLFTVYKRLFVASFALNVIALVLAATGHFPYAKKEAALFSVGNILALVLCRSEAFLRLVFWVAVKVLGRSWVPLAFRTVATSFLQCLGGIHSGCGVSSIMWLIYSLVQTLCHRESTSEVIIGVAAAILWFLFISSLAAFPLVRHVHHNVFEEIHRFAGWIALALLWAFVILTASYNPEKHAYHLRFSALAKKQDFYFTLLITFLIILPWLTVRKVAVQVSAPSGQASLIKFRGGVQAGVLGRISRSPLSDWHAFGIISDGKDEHMMLAGAVGDFTRGLVSNPPKYLYTRCIHFAGLPYLVNMYEKVVVVATGSGICVFLSFMLQPSRADVYFIWVAKAIQRNFGDDIVRKIESYPSEKMIIHDTAVSGRPNVAELTVKAVGDWSAQVVIVTSNPRGSRDVVKRCRAAGIPAFGPIWDS